MERRHLGSTDLQVSALGFGTSAIGGGLNRTTQREAVELIHYAIDSGINFFDTTAGTYHERMLGRAVRERRSRVVIAGKAGLQMSTMGAIALAVRPLLRPARTLFKHHQRELGKFRDSQKRYDFAPDFMRQQLESTLRTLKTDFIDLYQFFNVTTSALARDDLFEQMERLRTAGKIRHAGATVLTLDAADACLDATGLEALQIPVSLVERRYYERLGKSASFALIGSSPLAGGALTDTQSHVKLVKSSRISDDKLANVLARGQELSRRTGSRRTLAQAALRYALDLRELDAVLVSATTREQLEEDLRAVYAPPISSNELASLGVAAPAEADV